MKLESQLTFLPYRNHARDVSVLLLRGVRGRPGGDACPSGVLQVEQSWAWPRAGAAAELCGNRTDSDPIDLAVPLCRAGLQSLMDLVCGQVKEVQIIFHGVAVPQPISQANNSCKNQEAGVTAGLVASWGVTRARAAAKACIQQKTALFSEAPSPILLDQAACSLSVCPDNQEY